MAKSIRFAAAISEFDRRAAIVGDNWHYPAAYGLSESCGSFESYESHIVDHLGTMATEGTIGRRD